MLEHLIRGNADKPTLLLAHGFGASMHDLAPLANELDPEGFRWVFPQAPAEIPGYAGGYAWFPRQERELSAFATGAAFSDLSSLDPPGLQQSARELAELLDHLGADPENTIVGGFSQGAMIATELVLGGHWGRPAGLIILSGSLIAGTRWRAAAEYVKGLPVLQSHGTLDPILPEDQARDLGRLLSDAGARHQFVSFPGGHTIPASVFAAVTQFLAGARIE